MAAPVVSMQQLLESGAHFGHQTHRWNPKMKPYIFGDRNGIHIIDLSQTVPLFARALDFISQSVASGGKVLFVGTKRQAQQPISEAALRAGQHFVNHRWLGGMLTNWKTISGSIKRLKSLEERLSGDTTGITKKEVLQLTRERDKLELSLGGIRDLGGIPDIMFVIDANKEELAIKEANTLGIPVVAVLDSNVSPDGIAFPVPANDDASRAIRLYCEAVAVAAARGGQDAVAKSGADVGAMAEPPAEAALADSGKGASGPGAPESGTATNPGKAPSGDPGEKAPAENAPVDATEVAKAEPVAQQAETAPAAETAEAPAGEPAAKKKATKKDEADTAKAEKADAGKAEGGKTDTKKAGTKKAAAKKSTAKSGAAKKGAAKKDADDTAGDDAAGDDAAGKDPEQPAAASDPETAAEGERQLDA